MRAVAGPGRWVWALSGLVTAAVLVLPGARLITLRDGAVTASAEPQAVATRTVTVPQPVTSLTVQDNGGEVQVTAGQVSRVQVTETIMYDHQGNGPPAVAQSVSGGRLTLSDPACANVNCSVNFSLTVPFGVTVSVATQGGPATVSGVAGANLDTGGGPARVSLIGGPLTVSTEGGPLMLRGVTGPLRADTGGGTLLAQDVTSATATFTTGGGPATVSFAAAPESVSVSTDGGPALLAVPGGPYAVAADSGGGAQSVAIATDPDARPTLAVSTGGGPLRIEPAQLPPAPVTGAAGPAATRPSPPACAARAPARGSRGSRRPGSSRSGRSRVRARPRLGRAGPGRGTSAR